jgi:hypothetical protein
MIEYLLAGESMTILSKGDLSPVGQILLAGTASVFFCIVGSRFVVSSRKEDGRLLNSLRGLTGESERSGRENKTLSMVLGIGFLFLGLMSGVMSISLLTS